MNEAQEAKSELKRLTPKPYLKLILEEKYTIRYHIVVLPETLESICLHIATEQFKREPQSYSECFKIPLNL